MRKLVSLEEVAKQRDGRFVWDREENERQIDIHNISNLGERCETSVIGSQDQETDKLILMPPWRNSKGEQYRTKRAAGECLRSIARVRTYTCF